MPRRNSRVCLFFCSGYSAPLQSPTSSTSVAFTSNFCPLPGLSTICSRAQHGRFGHIGVKHVGSAGIAGSRDDITSAAGNHRAPNRDGRPRHKLVNFSIAFKFSLGNDLGRAISMSAPKYSIATSTATKSICYLLPEFLSGWSHH
eukprot:1090901-Rhodomonas_salina.1